MLEKHINSKEKLSRRRFIKNVSSAAAISSLILPVSGCSQKMKYRILGRTGIMSSVINSDELPEKAMYKMAIDAGVNYWHKMGRWGEPEIFAALDRDSFFCDLTIDSVEKEKAIEEFERGLGRSGLSMIDGFKVHSVYDYPEDIRKKTGIFKAFETLKKQGKTRFLMLSQHRNVVEIAEAAVDDDLFDVIQIPIHPFVTHDHFVRDKKFRTYSERDYLEVIKKASDKGIGITSMKTLAGGPKNWEKTPGAKELIMNYFPDTEHVTKALIHWTLDVPGVSTIASSMKSFEMFRENIEAAGGTITAQEKEGIKRFSEAMNRHVCRMCGICERENPGGVAVSDILRYSMYFTAYGDPDGARALYAELPSRSRVGTATNLDRYEKACPYGLPVAAKLREAHSLLA